MSNVKYAVIAAAGMGTRLGMGIPKCLVEIGGRPLIAHLLDLMKDVPDVCIVTGFMNKDVQEAARRCRNNLRLVENLNYQNTTTLGSYFLGSQGIDSSILYMDADILFEPHSFKRFLAACDATTKPLIAVTPTKTTDCVYVELGRGHSVLSFSRDVPSSHEWANLAWLPSGCIRNQPITVFECLKELLPLRSLEIDSYEIDDCDDLMRASAAFLEMQNFRR